MRVSASFSLPCLQTHPGKGVTTFIPDTRKSAAGGLSPRAVSGTSACGSGLHLVIGNRLLMLEQQVSVGVEAQAFMSHHEAQAQTCVLVGINGNVVAALAIADPLKPEARTVVGALHAQVGGCWAVWGSWDAWRPPSACRAATCTMRYSCFLINPLLSVVAPLC